ncbi:MAG: glycerate kinase [Oscillospiraceae bacterium]|nr:glycerate kinase [Oscillospiraceae bacterium]
MKIVIAADSFKGSLSSPQVVHRIARGLSAVLPEAQLVCLPIADGGEGTVEAFATAAGGTLHTVPVLDPLGREISAQYCILPDGSAVIEMAQASGLPLLKPHELDPLAASTYGTGQLIRHALDQGCRRFIVGVGGSATTDGGSGMAQALGVRMLDKEGRPLPPGGGALSRLERIDCQHMDPRLRESTFLVASDVDNVLCGPTGAAAVYGPQKGAKQQDIPLLDAALAHYGALLKEQLGADVSDRPGAGAAGGLGAGLMAFCQASLHSGIETVLDLFHFDTHVADADLVITGEGRIDFQSARGKVPYGVTRRTKSIRDIPVVAIVGCVGQGAEAMYEHGLDAIIPINDGTLTIEESIARAGELIEDTAFNLFHRLKTEGISFGSVY